MFDLIFLFILFLLLTTLIFVHFYEYQNNVGGRYMSMMKVNLWFSLGLVWFLNYLHGMMQTGLSMQENVLGAAGSFAFAIVIIFFCYPRMSRACQKFLLKRYAIIFVIGMATIFVPHIYLAVIFIGTVFVSYEIRRIEIKMVKKS